MGCPMFSYIKILQLAQLAGSTHLNFSISWMLNSRHADRRETWITPNCASLIRGRKRTQHLWNYVVVQLYKAMFPKKSSSFVELLRSSRVAYCRPAPNCASLIRGYPYCTPVGVPASEYPAQY